MPGQHELQHRRIRADSGLTLPISGILQMPQQPLIASISDGLSNASIDVLGSPEHTSEIGQRAVLDNRNSNPSPKNSPRRLPARHQPKIASSSGRNLEDLETRFARVIKIVEESGFEGIDDLSTQYYTAAFKEDTAPFWAQSRSRSRSLPGFLSFLHESTKTWPTRDMQGYKQQVTNMAEDIYVG